MTALVAERTEARDVRLVAQRIALSQSDEITLMKTWLRQRGEPVPGEGAHAGHEMHAGHLMPGMLNAAELDTLRNSRGVEFEKHFLRYTIKHHEGAVAMVAQLFRSQGGGQQSEIYAFAADVDADQQMEIERMLRLLAARPSLSLSRGSLPMPQSSLRRAAVALAFAVFAPIVGAQEPAAGGVNSRPRRCATTPTIRASD